MTEDIRQKRLFNNVQIGKMIGKSRSYVYGVKSGKRTAPDEVKAQIKGLSTLTNSDLEVILKDELFYEICELAISKSKDINVIKYAVLCQQISQKLRTR